VSFVVGGVLVGATVLSLGAQAIAANKASKAQRQAIQQQQAQDAADKAKAEADAANEANQLRVAQKRAYQANVLALGGNNDDTLGAAGTPQSVLSRGSSTATRAAAVQPAVSVLGGGSPLTSSAVGQPGGGSRARTPYARNLR
jgi:hypothetical protein